MKCIFWQFPLCLQHCFLSFPLLASSSPVTPPTCALIPRHSSYLCLHPRHSLPSALSCSSSLQVSFLFWWLCFIIHWFQWELSTSRFANVPWSLVGLLLGTQPKAMTVSSQIVWQGGLGSCELLPDPWLTAVVRCLWCLFQALWMVFCSPFTLSSGFNILLLLLWCSLSLRKGWVFNSQISSASGAATHLCTHQHLSTGQHGLS